jgi:hypothetical protein
VQVVLVQAFVTVKLSMKKETRIAAKRDPLLGAYRTELKAGLATTNLGPLLSADAMAEPERFAGLINTVPKIK